MLTLKLLMLVGEGDILPRSQREILYSITFYLYSASQ